MLLQTHTIHNDYHHDDGKKVEVVRQRRSVLPICILWTPLANGVHRRTCPRMKHEDTLAVIIIFIVCKLLRSTTVEQY